MKLLFLDESGDHNLLKIDPQYPVFVLSGVVFDASYHTSVLEPALAEFKQHWFGTTEIHLHTADITRHRNGFEKLEDTAFRKQFYTALACFIEKIEFQIIAVAIDKYGYQRTAVSFPNDAYSLAMESITESFCKTIHYPRGGLIIAEKRSKKLDTQLYATWERVIARGAGTISGYSINQTVMGMLLRSKGDNYAGLQIADLVATPIGRYISGKSSQADWHAIAQKISQSGLTILPKERRARPATQSCPSSVNLP